MLKGTSDRILKNTPERLTHLRNAPPEPRFASSWPVVFSLAVPTATSRAGDVQHTWSRCAVELLLSAPVPSCPPPSHRIRSGARSAIPQRAQCWKCRWLTSHGPNVDRWESGAGGSCSPLLSLGRTILSAFHQLLGGPSRLEPTHPQWLQVQRSPRGRLFLLSCLPLPSPSSFSLGSLPKISILNLLLCTCIA